MRPQFAVYEGKEKQRLVTHIVGDTYYVAIAMSEEIHQTAHHELVKELKTQLESNDVKHLKQLEMIIENILIDFNISDGFSLSAAVVNDSLLYLKTVGEGQIYIEREKKLARIIEGEQSASGYVQKGDTYLLTTAQFTNSIGDDEEIRKVISYKNKEKIGEAMTEALKGAKDQGTVAIVLHFDGRLHLHEEINLVDQPVAADPVEETVIAPPISEPAVPKPSLFSRLSRLLKRRQTAPQPEPTAYDAEAASPAPKKRIITIAVVAVIFVILIWSVVLGYRRRADAENQKKITASAELINQKLNQADEVAFLNMARSMVLFNEAKEELSKLKKEIGDTKDPKVAELEKTIQTREDEISKKEDKSAEEFYDMAIENKQASGTRMSLDGKDAVILDAKNNSVYILSLEKKSLDKRTASEIGQASVVTLDGDTVIMYVNGKGIYTVDEDNKAEKVIDNDKDWGTITAMTVYNGNLYVLDTGKNDVYKYVATNDGYGGKASYFKGTIPDLDSANSLSIDSSVYIGVSDKVHKFTSGLADDFKPSFPDQTLSITKAFTSLEANDVYVWDKSKGVIYVVDKDGDYQKQVKSGALAKGDDFVALPGAAYVLVKDKIFKVSLD